MRASPLTGLHRFLRLVDLFCQVVNLTVIVDESLSLSISVVPPPPRVTRTVSGHPLAWWDLQNFEHQGMVPESVKYIDSSPPRSHNISLENIFFPFLLHSH